MHWLSPVVITQNEMLSLSIFLLLCYDKNSKSKGKFRLQVKRNLFFSAFLFLAYVSLILPGPQQKKKLLPSEEQAAAIEKNLLEMVNQERTQSGLQPVKHSPELAVLARHHSQDMALCQNKDLKECLSHISSSGKSYTDRLVDGGVFFIKNGENVAFSETYLAEYVHQGFMSSQGHRENILNPDFNQLGVGVVYNEKKKAFFVTQDFIERVILLTEEEAANEIRKRINGLRVKNSLPPLSFFNDADEFARTYSLSKASEKKQPSFPAGFGQTDLFFFAHPSLDQLQESCRGKILDKIYETGGLGITFGRNNKYRGGSYFLTLILFPESKYKSWKREDVKEVIFSQINKTREKSGLLPLEWDSKLTHHAQKTSMKTFGQKDISSMPPPGLRGSAYFFYVTEDPTIFSKKTEEKIAKELSKYSRIGIGIQFGKNREFPRGVFWVVVFLEE